jgi:Flp pilus assembly protein TadG
LRFREKNRMKKSATRLRKLLSSEKGAELIELAFTLPFFLLIIIGIVDFGGAWAERDQIEGAARNGARVAVATFNDTTNPQCGGGSVPCSVQVAVDAVLTALSNAGTLNCGMTAAGIAATGAPFTWNDTATCGNGGTFTITVERTVPEVDASAGSNVTVLTTKVTISYPYTFRLNMSGGSIFSGNPFARWVTLNGTATMVNLN